jgi:hypothetical protein
VSCNLYVTFLSQLFKMPIFTEIGLLKLATNGWLNHSYKLKRPP